ncbi:MAG: hypothetical protein IJF92_03745 [Bacilli bacterium]|nr:hypothetical protein [Bacilli bacterium]
MYPNIQDDDLITAKKYGRYAKSDMVIEVNGIKKGISIKCGAKNSVHVEKVYKFINVIDKLRFKYSNELSKYLYSDGSNNNTGRNRITTTEYKQNHKDEIKLINSNLNNRKILEKLVYRFLICADVNYKVKVDAFIYGTVYDFMWCTKEEAINYLLVNSDFDSTGVHTSKLFIQLWNKNINHNPKYEWCREYIQVKWYSLFDDIIQIMCLRK